MFCALTDLRKLEFVDAVVVEKIIERECETALESRR